MIVVSKVKPHSTEVRAHINIENSLSLIRIIAVFSVICVHIADNVNGGFEDSDNINWWVGHTYQSIFRSGIPLFLMLTGALLIPKAESVNFVRERFSRVLIPFLIWVLVFFIAKNRIVDLTFKDYLSYLLIGNSYTYHLWYIYFILVVYLTLPFIKLLIDKFHPSINIVLLLLVVSSSIFYFLPGTCDITYQALKYLVYFQFVIFGYYLVHERPDIKYKSSRVAVALILIGFLVTFIGTLLKGTGHLDVQNLLYDSAMFHIFIKALGVWLLIAFYAPRLPEKYTKLIRRVSDLSFGIYIIHPLVWEHIVITRLGISLSSFKSTFVSTGLSALLCYLLGVLIIYSLSKIPFGKFTY